MLAIQRRFSFQDSCITFVNVMKFIQGYGLYFELASMLDNVSAVCAPQYDCETRIRNPLFFLTSQNIARYIGPQ